ncbi:inducible T cell costimulator ligand [Rhinolophus ferrumequinum]|uniref:ICOS ligand n=1 Tax=Rhinolophus ferrumequinum TaxID=59479 RepID=A0A671DIQ3_RHIFE|nr:ICOS ligand isoform X1 [Rhinolophus ferrumequinum]KAF6384827.1 inducible T cell costimulator ligand [Rhinolophus ferrumequinum]
MRLRSPAPLLLLFSGLLASDLDIQQEEVRAMVGSDVTLKCMYTKEDSLDLKDLYVYWQISAADKPTIVTYYLSTNNSTGHNDNQYKGRAKVSLDSMKRGDFSLRLYNVTPQDEEKYDCLVILKFNKILHVVVTLHVAANYSMPVVSAPSSGPQGEELIITCTSTDGYPWPNVYWINKTDNSLLDKALQNSTVSRNARGLYDVVSVLRIRWASNVDIDCCIENVLLLQNLTVSSQMDSETLPGTKDSITESLGDNPEGRTRAVVAGLVVLGVAVAAAAAGWMCRSRCPRHWTYTAGAQAARRELELTDHA